MQDLLNIFMRDYSLEQRKMWYRLTGQPIWLHAHCINRNGNKNITAQNPLWKQPFWVVGFHCDQCDMGIEDEDFYAGRTVGEMTLYKLDPKYDFSNNEQ